MLFLVSVASHEFCSSAGLRAAPPTRTGHHFSRRCAPLVTLCPTNHPRESWGTCTTLTSVLTVTRQLQTRPIWSARNFTDRKAPVILPVSPVLHS